MIRAIYPGSFDPVTNGHIDIAKRALRIVDELVIGVLNNSNKTALFSADERVKMLQDTLGAEHPKIRVESFSGLTVDFAKQVNANIIIRGLRAVTDYEYDLHIAQINYELCPELETTFLMANIKYAFLSSSMVKEIASFGGDISDFVPPLVADQLREMF